MQAARGDDRLRALAHRSHGQLLLGRVFPGFNLPRPNALPAPGISRAAWSVLDLMLLSVEKPSTSTAASDCVWMAAQLSASASSSPTGFRLWKRRCTNPTAGLAWPPRFELERTGNRPLISLLCAAGPTASIRLLRSIAFLTEPEAVKRPALLVLFQGRLEELIRSGSTPGAEVFYQKLRSRLRTQLRRQADPWPGLLAPARWVRSPQGQLMDASALKLSYSLRANQLPAFARWAYAGLLGPRQGQD